MKKVLYLLLLLPVILSCETGQGASDLSFNLNAKSSFDRLTETGIPKAEKVNAEINGKNSLTDLLHNPCEAQKVAQVGYETDATDGKNYNNSQRESLVEQIIKNGPKGMKTSIVIINGEKYEVMNDNVSLPDGTYVPLTFPEAQRIAKEWGWKIPSSNQIRGIREHAEKYGHVYKGITRKNTYEADRVRSINDMMNDKRMRDRSERGKKELINGHFKWYTNDGKIMGLKKGGSGYYHNNASGAHRSQPHYTDYSHGVRLIRKI